MPYRVFSPENRSFSAPDRISYGLRQTLTIFVLSSAKHPKKTIEIQILKNNVRNPISKKNQKILADPNPEETNPNNPYPI